MKKERIAVIGAGVMGCDLSLTLAAHQWEVILIDRDACKLGEAKTRIQKNYRFYRMMSKAGNLPMVEGLPEKIRYTTELGDCGEAAMIIENITEDTAAKTRLYQDLRTLIDDRAIVGVNTSCIPITGLASQLERPARVIGMHFMNPVPLKEVVEVIRGYHTDEETIDATRRFLGSIRKTAIVVNDYPGFVTNRLSHLFMNEAAFLVQDQVARPAEIDALFKKGYGHMMGPLETADLIGLDTVLHSLNVLFQHYQDTKFRCCPLLNKMVSAGLLGKKSGEGFYKY